MQIEAIFHFDDDAPGANGRLATSLRPRCQEKILTSRQYRVEAFQGIIDFFTGNYQRWRNANGVAVGILAEETQFLEFLAVLAGPTRFGQQFDADHQPFTPDFFYEGTGDLFQSLQKICPHFR